MSATPWVTLYKQPAPVAAFGAEPGLIASFHLNSLGSEMSLLFFLGQDSDPKSLMRGQGRSCKKLLKMVHTFNPSTREAQASGSL